MDNLIFSLESTLPLFILIAIGFFLRYKKIVDETFVDSATKIVFNVALPAIIFKSIVLSDTDLSIINFKVSLFCLIGYALIVLLSWTISSFFVKNKPTRGALIQGIYRSNNSIFGIPLILALFGDTGVAIFTVSALIPIIPFNNIMAVIILHAHSAEKTGKSIRQSIIKILKNPLIIALLVSLIFWKANITMPTFVSQTINHLSSLAIALALIAIGAFMNKEKIKESYMLSTIGAVIKVFIIPIIAIPLAIVLGFRGIDLACIFVMFGAPCAISCFVMASAMKCDGKLSASMVIISTFLSIFTITAGIWILKSLSFI